jgi:hypothetical protein
VDFSWINSYIFLCCEKCISLGSVIKDVMLARVPMWRVLIQALARRMSQEGQIRELSKRKDENLKRDSKNNKKENKRKQLTI